jgi:hypothetical protein
MTATKEQGQEAYDIINLLLDDFYGPRMNYPEEVEESVYALAPRMLALTNRKIPDAHEVLKIHMLVYRKTPAIAREEMLRRLRALMDNSK